MAREKEYLVEVVIKAENGRTIEPHIAYRRDRYKPWTVDIERTEMSPAYRDIGHAQAFLRRHYGIKNNPDATEFHYAGKSIFFDRLGVLPCDR